MSTHTDKIVHWLLSNLQLESSLFHIGQYCGDWRASTAGKTKASFHVIAQGNCWLHFPDGRASVPLHAGEAVFLLRDVPHYLSPEATPLPSTEPFSRLGTLRPFGETLPSAVGIVCGFFEFKSAIGKSMTLLLPDYLVVRSNEPAYAGIRAVFDLILAEAERDPGTSSPSPSPSPLILRLTDLLLFYAVRQAAAPHAAASDSIASGLSMLIQRPEFSTLVAAIIDTPSAAWTTNTMASHANMSRATFCKHFVEICGQPPAQFVTLIRMKMAAELLEQGAAITDAAQHTGYQSESSFSHAFKRVMGMQPGAYRRTQAASETARSLALAH